jgi:precorrin-6B C5,15-methyltransferase / cobalt-precorrin-6B C5,C15-methyltransferase
VTRVRSPIGRWLSIVGVGEDGLEGLSPTARSIIKQASLVVGGRRHLSLVAGATTGETMIWPSPPQAAFPAIRARSGTPVCIVATGDPFFYGIGSLLAAVVPPEQTICLPGPSSFSLAASRLGWAVQTCALVSLHGRALELITPHLQPNARILALSWDHTTPNQLAQLLVRCGLGDTNITVCEALGGPRERLRSARAGGFMFDDIDPLNLAALEVRASQRTRVIPLTPGLPDAWFENDGQLTKQDVRAVTLAALAPRRGELLWDIGAGSGSIGIEWMLADPANRAVAVERDPTRVGRIARNAAALGVPDLSIIEGSAPAVLQGLPRPDAVFIGGGAGFAIDAAWNSLPCGGRMVANGITIETQAELIRRFKTLGGSLKTIQIAHADPIGGLNALRPAIAVTQWSAIKP